MRTDKRNEKKYLFLMPFSWLYGLIVRIRNLLFGAGWLPAWEIPIPSVCVGNITAGGTGKTPHIEYLIELLKERYSVAVISRGYGRKTSGTLFAGTGHTACEIGDEPAQLLQKFPGISLIIDGNRKRGIEYLLRQKPGTEVLLMDDGFQHRSVKPGLSVVLMDSARPANHDHLLPYGRLREHRSALQRADVIILTKCPGSIPMEVKNQLKSDLKIHKPQQFYCTTFQYQKPVPVFQNGKPLHPGFNTGSCVLVTGIASPRRLKQHLEQQSIETEHLAFPDHHLFSEKDVQTIYHTFKGLKKQPAHIFSTEKDAARLRAVEHLIPATLKESWYYIPIRVAFLHGDRKPFDENLIQYVDKNRIKPAVSY